MSKWAEVPVTSRSGKRRAGPKTETVMFYSYRHKSDTPNRGRIAISEDLMKGERVSVETDGGTGLRIRFDENGHSKLHKGKSSTNMYTVELRLNAVAMFPKKTMEVEYNVKDGSIYIDTSQFKGIDEESAAA